MLADIDNWLVVEEEVGDREVDGVADRLRRASRFAIEKDAIRCNTNVKGRRTISVGGATESKFLLLSPNGPAASLLELSE
jgi:hypothetical protein